MSSRATSSPPLWRSLLYVPVNQRRFVDKAHTRGADAIQLDLEDSIAPAEKDEARRQLPDAVERLAAHGVDVVVRINRPWRIAVRDVEVAVRPGVRALALPKVASADHVHVLDEVVTEVEAQAGMATGSVGFIAMIETADALFRMREIAGAGPRVWAVTLGSEDLATSLGIEPHPDLLSSHKMALIAAARAAGVWPLGLIGTLADYSDVEAFRAVARQSRRAGCVGASAIHPVQVPILNEEFSPDPEAVARAQRLVQAYDDAHARGVGAIEFEGSMVDEPVAERARALIRVHESIAVRG
jgi:citrate lyase subunit beta/citryl-CoA lyase